MIGWQKNIDRMSIGYTVRLIYLLSFVLVTILLFVLPLVLARCCSRHLVLRCYGCLCRIGCWFMATKIIIHGKLPEPGQSVLYVSNHQSYMDILVLGTVLPATFLSKFEVKSWPLIGQIAQLIGTVFVRRDRRHVRADLAGMRARFEAGLGVVLFPEGTTTMGCRVARFNSSLFGFASELAESKDILIQPITIVYSQVNGLPVTRDMRASIAWIGDMELAPHIVEFHDLGRVTCEVILHEPFSLREAGSRKGVAERAYSQVARGLQVVLRGRGWTDQDLLPKEKTESADLQLSRETAV